MPGTSASREICNLLPLFMVLLRGFADFTLKSDPKLGVVNTDHVKRPYMQWNRMKTASSQSDLE